MPGDVERCLKEIGAAAVMSAEGLLSNPMLFEGRVPLNYSIANEYLDFAERYDGPSSAARAHIFRICHYRSRMNAAACDCYYCPVCSFQEYVDLRERCSASRDIADLRAIVKELERRCVPLTTAKDGTTYLDGTETTLAEQVDIK